VLFAAVVELVETTRANNGGESRNPEWPDGSSSAGTPIFPGISL